MAYKQPRIPPLREEEGAGAYLRELILFLKDFCLETWLAVTKIKKQVDTLPEESPLPFCDDAPKAPGTASAGQAETIARGDHVHPYPIRLVHSEGDSYTYLSKTATNRTHSLVTEEADGSGSVGLYVGTDNGVPTIRYQDAEGNVKHHGLYSTANKPTAGDVGALPMTGGTASGLIKAPNFVVGNATDYPSIGFQGKDVSKGQLGAIQFSGPSNGRRFSFVQYPSDQDGATTRYLESYQLPKPDAGLTETKYYNIYTTKNPPTPAQVGGFVGCHAVSMASGSIVSGATGTATVTFTAITGAASYQAVLIGAGSIYGWVTGMSISGTTLTVTFFNSSGAAHTIGCRVLIIGVK